MYRPADVLCAVGCQSALRQAADLPRASRPAPLTVLTETGPEFLVRPTGFAGDYCSRHTDTSLTQHIGFHGNSGEITSVRSGNHKLNGRVTGYEGKKARFAREHQKNLTNFDRRCVLMKRTLKEKSARFGKG